MILLGSKYAANMNREAWVHLGFDGFLPVFLYDVCVCHINDVVHVEVGVGVVFWRAFCGVPGYADEVDVFDVNYAVVISVGWDEGAHEGMKVLVTSVEDVWCVAYAVMVSVCASVVAPIITLTKTIIPKINRMILHCCIMVVYVVNEAVMVKISVVASNDFNAYLVVRNRISNNKIIRAKVTHVNASVSRI
jgi:hypothetical protein